MVTNIEQTNFLMPIGIKLTSSMGIMLTVVVGYIVKNLSLQFESWNKPREKLGTEFRILPMINQQISS